MSQPIKEAKLKGDLKKYANAIERTNTILEEGRDSLPGNLRNALGGVWPDLSHIVFKLRALSKRRVLSEREEQMDKEDMRDLMIPKAIQEGYGGSEDDYGF